MEFDYETCEDGYVVYDLNGKSIPPWNIVAVLNKMSPELQLALTKLQENDPIKKVNNG